MPNKGTGPNAGGPRQFPISTSLTARVGQFWISIGAQACRDDARGQAGQSLSTANVPRLVDLHPPQVAERPVRGGDGGAVETAGYGQKQGIIGQ